MLQGCCQASSVTCVDRVFGALCWGNMLQQHTRGSFTLWLLQIWSSVYSCQQHSFFLMYLLCSYRAAVLRWQQSPTVDTRLSGWPSTPVTETIWRAMAANWTTSSMICPSTWPPSPGAVSASCVLGKFDPDANSLTITSASTICL